MPLAPHPQRRRFRSLPRLLVLLLVNALLLPPATGRAQAVEPQQTSVVLLSESFESGALPDGWQTVRAPLTIPDWEYSDSGQRGNQTLGSGRFASIDSHRAPQLSIDASLISPRLPLNGAGNVTLQFNTLFEPFETSTADVDISTDGGQSWQNVWRTTSHVRGLVSLNISRFTASRADIQVRFRYYQASWDWFWQIDNVQVVALMSPPSAPGALSASGAGGEARLSWSDTSADETGFLIERSTDGASWTSVATVAANQTQYLDRSLDCGRSYSYRVRSSGRGGSSAPTTLATAQTAACPTLTALSEQFTPPAQRPASWTPAGWSVSTQGARGWSFGGLSTTSITDPHLAFVANSFSGAQAITTTLSAPPVNLRGRAAVRLRFDSMLWQFNGHDLTANVDISSDGGQSWTSVWDQTHASGSSLISQTIDVSRLAANQPHVMLRFRIQTQGLGLWALDNVRLEPTPPPAAVSTLQGRLGNSRVNGRLENVGLPFLTWNAVADAAFYEIERSPDGQSAWAKVGEARNGTTSFVDNQAARNTSYSYRVWAANSAGRSPSPSNSVSVASGGDIATFLDLNVSYYGATNPATRAAIEANIRYFADAAYEMSNGVIRLRRIQIYENGQFADRADIVWVRECWPNAHTSGFGHNGLRIQHCDIFGSANFITSDLGHRQGGYILAHELGHYLFALFDEYRSFTPCERPSSACPTDLPVPNSIMNSMWVAARDNTFDDLNFSTALNNTGLTAQHRAYGASGWETLVRSPEQDPPSAQTVNSLPRFYMPELLTAAPAPGQRPSVELPGQREQARAQLQITWMGGIARSPQAQLQAAASPTAILAATSSVTQLLIDTSTLQDSARIDEVKAAIAQVIRAAEPGEAFGILSFDGAVTTTLALSTVADELSREQMLAAINLIAPGANEPALGAAVQAALDSFSAPDVPLDAIWSVYLFTSGRNSGITHTLAALTGLQEQSVPVYVFDLSAGAGDASGDLQTLAEQSDGAYHPISDGKSLLDAIAAGETETEPLPFVSIDAYELVVDSSELSTTMPLYIDESTARFFLSGYYEGDSGTANIVLVRPDGSPADVVFYTETFSDELGTYTYFDTTLSEPISGSWGLALWSAEERYIAYWAGAEMYEGVRTFAAQVEIVEGDELVYPAPAVIRAWIGKDNTITDATVFGEMYGPEGEMMTVKMRDDGLGADEVAGDGFYGGIAPYAMDGEHYLRVLFFNDEGKALFTDKGTVTLPGPNGETYEPQTTPVGANFQRLADTIFTVRGWQEDDHAEALDAATEVQPDNSQYAGRIDTAADMDLFRFTVPATATEELVVRISELGLGMNPYLVAWDAGETWEIEGFTEQGLAQPTSQSQEPPGQGGFLSVKLPAQPGQTVYVAVWHVDETASEGLYTFSVGAELAIEPALQSTREKPPFSQVNLPVITR